MYSIKICIEHNQFCVINYMVLFQAIFLCYTFLIYTTHAVISSPQVIKIQNVHFSYFVLDLSIFNVFNE